MTDVELDVARGIITKVQLGIALTKQSLWLNQMAGSLEAAIALEKRAPTFTMK